MTPPPPSLALTLSETTRTIVSVGSFGLYFCEKLVNRLIESLLSFFIYCRESDGDCWLPGFVLDAKVAHKFLQSHCHMHWCCCKIFHNHAALGHQCAWTQSADFYLFSWTIMWLPPLPESSHFIQTSSHILQTGGELIISLALHSSNWEMAFHGVTWPLFHHLAVRCCHRPLVAEARKDVSLRFLTFWILSKTLDLLHSWFSFFEICVEKIVKENVELFSGSIVIYFLQ